MTTLRLYCKQLARALDQHAAARRAVPLARHLLPALRWYLRDRQETAWAMYGSLRGNRDPGGSGRYRTHPRALRPRSF